MYKTWKTKGRILSLKKVMPLVHMYHVKKDKQSIWDSSPYVHGSNGTYVENANPFWILKVKVKRPSREVREPTPIEINIHDYITQKLMPNLGWERMSQNRLDQLNKVLSGTEMELETSDITEAVLSRIYLPIGFRTWDDYLDSVILP